MNSRFSLAVHLLTLLAVDPSERITSEFLAKQVKTNPVVIRRLLAALRVAGVVTSKGAAGGGWQLTRPPGEITLAQIRQALEPCKEAEKERVFRLQRNVPYPNCPVGRAVNGALGLVFDRVQTAIDAELATITVQQVLETNLSPAEIAAEHHFAIH